MKLTKCFALLLILLAALGSAQLMFAQGTDLGTITGSVTDGTGALVPNAKVVILDLATKATARDQDERTRGVPRIWFELPGNTRCRFRWRG